MLRRVVVLSILAAASWAVPSFGAVLHDEALNGELSSDRLHPTAHALGVGSNLVSGTMGPGDLDYLTVSLATGMTLNRIMLTLFEGDSFVSFIAIQSGTTFTVPATTQTPANLLGWAHFTAADTDLLAKMAQGSGAIGFTPSLAGPGSYTLWLQEIDDPVRYGLDLQVTAVPEPSTWAALLAGLLTIGGWKAIRRRSR